MSDDELLDENGDIQLDEATNKLLYQDPDKFNAYLPLNKFQFGSEKNCDNFEKALPTESKLRTKHDPFPW
ncbi:hypothetical protein RSOL_052500, partial [Rhizoctonia solani AG-3 Rhs1AP]